MALSCLTVVAALALAGCGSNGGAGSGAGSAGTQSASGGAQKHKPKSAIEAYVNKTPNYAAVPASAPVQSGTVKIAYRNFAIDPDTAKVKVGSTVRWTNYDPSPHDVTSESGPIKFASKHFKQGESFSVKMTKPGVVHYENTLEPTTMNGTIEVVE